VGDLFFNVGADNNDSSFFFKKILVKNHSFTSTLNHPMLKNVFVMLLFLLKINRTTTRKYILLDKTMSFRDKQKQTHTLWIFVFLLHVGSSDSCNSKRSPGVLKVSATI